MPIQIKKPALLVILLALFVSTLLIADPVIHHFEIWRERSFSEKLSLYTGWINGFLLARGEFGPPLVDCLSKLTYTQAVAMIDKYFNDHPERWNATLGEGILEAMTVPGTTCQGKSPLPKHD